MLFNSFQFVLFYVIVTLLYFNLPLRYRTWILLAASCYFYMAFVPYYIVILAFTIVVDFIAGIYIEKSVGKKRRLMLILSLVSNIGILAFFKYYNFLNLNVTYFTETYGGSNWIPYLTILLPLGLSFHTFQAMSYSIEVYRGKQPAERNFGIFSLYVMFYPQLVSGPIERPGHMLPQLHKEHRFDYGNMVSGLQLMLWGFIKKLVIADRLAIYVDSVFGTPDLQNGTSVVIAAVFFAVQIYCDFSGYSDIAIGCARTMGYHLNTNFNLPYFSTSISEFWTKWHISLSSWFRDYLYIPLGGNRVSKARWFCIIILVFFVSGLWHGANYTFIAWGLLHASFYIIGSLMRPYTSVLEKKLRLENTILLKALKICLTFSLVTFAWIIFRAASISDALTLIHNLKTFGQRLAMGSGLNQFSHCVLAIVLLFAVESVMEYFPAFSLFRHRWRWVRWTSVVAAVFIILLFGVFNGGQFIYYQF